MRTARFIIPSLLAFLLTGTEAGARTLDPAEAWSRLAETKSAITSTVARAPAMRPELVYTETTAGQPSVYLFAERQSGRYFLVAADDCADALLGYTDADTPVDPDNLPPNFEAWLDETGRQISTAAAEGRTVGSSLPTDLLESVVPIMTTKWNQDAPYNNRCPKVGDARSYTGCVATAAAQILKTYEYPTRGEGSYSYDWNGTTLSFDYDKTTFHWSQMTDTYDETSTNNQKTAVATLMYAIGVASNMNYSPSASGATTINLCRALIRNFGYDRSLNMKMRNYYPLEQWRSMLHDELSAGYPVYYEGSGTGTHAFVLDGYDAETGFFHVNWGWGGSSNGYFQITTLEPGSQGIGGSTAGYSNSQIAVFSLRKPVEGSEPTPYLVLNNDLTTNEPVYTRDRSVTLLGGETNTGIYSYSVESLKYEFGLELTDATGNISYVWSVYAPLGLEAYYGYTGLDFNASSFPAEGTYRATMVIRCNGRIVPVPAPLGCASAMTVECTPERLTFTPVTNRSEIAATDPEFITPLYVGKSAIATATVSNAGAEYYGEIKLGFVAPGDTRAENILLLFENTASIDILGGETAEVSLRGTIRGLSAGDYLAGVFDNRRQLISELVPVHINPEPQGAASVSIESIKFPDALGGTGTREDPYILYRDIVDFDLTMRCNSGYFDDGVTAWVYNPGIDSPILGINGRFDPFDAGHSETIRFSGEVSKLDAGHTYVFLIYNSTRGQWINASGYYFSLVDRATGISSVAEVAVTPRLVVSPNPAADFAEVWMSGTGLRDLTLYNLTGAPLRHISCDGSTATIDLRALPSGHYILRASTSEGTPLTARIIKR
ncbi:MAG: thiol protease/hemagglutinin PrtT [Clostridium sp.]|nr:thiol protease/hemagglutinin PrtT [Clostridium sp.]